MYEGGQGSSRHLCFRAVQVVNAFLAIDKPEIVLSTGRWPGPPGVKKPCTE